MDLFLIVFKIFEMLKIRDSSFVALLILRHFIQTEAERRRREAGVKQSMEIRLGSCRWVGGYVWYLELSREPKHAAQ